MTDIPRMPPGRRFYARLDKFEVSCPHCGGYVFAGISAENVPKRLQQNNRARAAAKQRPRSESVLRMFWNPHTQRWRCLWCRHVYTVGVVFYPVKARSRRITVPPQDCDPTPEDVAEMRRLGGGWTPKQQRGRPEEWANLVVHAECSCPFQGTDPVCPLHDQVTLAGPPVGTSEGGESE